MSRNLHREAAFPTADSSKSSNPWTVDSLKALIASREERNSTLNLSGDSDEAVEFLDALDQTIDCAELDEETRKKFTSFLRKCVGTWGVLPTSHTLSGKIRVTSDGPHASGGFADVWIGTYKGQGVAIKALRTRGADDLVKVKKLFCKEALVWRRLSHPNVLSFLGASTGPSPFCLVSPWMVHGNIKQYLKLHPDANALELLVDVSNGLHYLHSINLVHGDLKAANILINSEFQACIADFGLMKVASDSRIADSFASMITKTANGGGTIRWMAPELLLSLQDGEPTKSSDMYAMGMVILEVLTGRIPFFEYRDESLLYKVVKGGRPARPTQVMPIGSSDIVWKTMEGCWDQDPHERPQISTVLRNLKEAAPHWVPARPSTPNSDCEFGDSNSSNDAFFAFVRSTPVVDNADESNASAEVVKARSEKRESTGTVMENDREPSRPSALKSSLKQRKKVPPELPLLDMFSDQEERTRRLEQKSVREPVADGISYELDEVESPSEATRRDLLHREQLQETRPKRTKRYSLPLHTPPVAQRTSIIPRPRPTSLPSDGVLAASEGNFQNSKSMSSASSNRILNDYTMSKTLGAGDIAKVKLAHHNFTNEQFAVKIIPRGVSNLKNFNSEVAAARQEILTLRETTLCMLLYHPHICSGRELIVHQHHYYMVLEYISGGQLLDYIISHGRLRERVARKFARQLGSALEYCHKHNVVHRDLKVENILVSETGDIKLIDFGISNLYDPTSHLSTPCGSMYFPPPELLDAKLYVGPEVDVWSFAVVLYVLVCAKVPFDGDMPAIRAQIMQGLVEYPWWLSSECHHLLSRMLVANTSTRASLAEVMNHPWMIRGFSGPPDPYLVQRKPLHSDEIDLNVIRGMKGFGFGSGEDIERDLIDVLESDSYHRSVQYWEQRRSGGVTGRPSTANGSSTISTTSVVSDGISRTDSASTSTRTTRLFPGLDFRRRRTASVSSSPPSNPRSPYAFTYEKEPADPIYGFHPLISMYFLSREKMEREREDAQRQSAGSQISLRRRRLSQASPREAFKFDEANNAEEEMENVRRAMKNQRQNGARRNSIGSLFPSVSPIQGRQVPVSHHPSTSLDQRAIKQERRSSTGGSMFSSGSAGRRRGLWFKSAKPENLFAEESEATSKFPSVNDREMGRADPPQDDKTFKPVFLKGLFSVMTTTTKPVKILLVDVRRVLHRMRIHYRETRTGFDCVFLPSLDLSALPGVQTSHNIHQKDSPSYFSSVSSRKSRHKDTTSSDASVKEAENLRGRSDLSRSPTTKVLLHTPREYSTGASTVVEENDLDMFEFNRENPSSVTFEINVVKMPLLPLHGLQFHRVGGDGWQYQTLARRVLKELKL